MTHNPNFAGTVNNGTLEGANFLTFFNYGKAKVYGIDAGVNVTILPSVQLALKYSWLNAEFDENDANKDGMITQDEKSINAPNHRGVAMLTVQNLFKERLTLSLGARLMQKYDFYSGNQVGSEASAGTRTPPKNFNYDPLGGFSTFDFSTEYRWSKTVWF